MKILLDQGIPAPIRSHLKGHFVRTAAQQGWDRLRNGDLLRAAELAGFDLLLTTDQSMGYQQNLAGRTIAILVLGKQRWKSLRPHTELVLAAVNAAEPGYYKEVEIPAS